MEIRLCLAAVIVVFAFSGAGTAGAPAVPSVSGVLAVGQNESVRRITPAELRQLLRRRKAVIVDVRSRETYQAGHIVGALSMPIDEVATRAGELPRNKLIATYCS
ncbi:MAG: hypothetical protein QOD75_397 [Blastocatellia bacterium]|nr:hypothetical protein [Blastocatellia bacterium]